MGNSRRSISVPSQGGCSSFLFSYSSSPSWPFLSSPSRESQPQCVSPLYHSSFVTLAPSQFSKPVSDGSPTCRTARPFAFRGSRTRVSSLENSFDAIGFRGNSFPTTCCSDHTGSSGSSTKGWLQQTLSDDPPGSFLGCQERPPAEAELSPAFADTRRGTCRIPLHSPISSMPFTFREESSSLSVNRGSICQEGRKVLLFPALLPLDLIDQPHPAGPSVSWGKNGKETRPAKPGTRATFDTDRSDSDPRLLDSSPARSFSSSVAFSAPSSFASCASPNISRGKKKMFFRSMAFTPLPCEEGNSVFASRPSLSFVGLGGVETTVATLDSTADEKSHERFVCSRGVKHFEWTIRKRHESKSKQTRRLGEKAATRGESGPLLIMSLHRLTRNMRSETTTVDPPRTHAFVPGPVPPSLFYRPSSCLSSPSSRTSEYRHPCESSPASSSLSSSPSSASLSPSSPFRCDTCCSTVSSAPQGPNSPETEGKDEKEGKAHALGFFRETQSSRTLSETRRTSSGKETDIAASETKLCLVSHALAASSSWSPSAESGSGLADEEMEETPGGLKAFSRGVLHSLEDQRKGDAHTDHETLGEPKHARSLLSSMVSPEFQKSNCKKAKSEERDETCRQILEAASPTPALSPSACASSFLSEDTAVVNGEGEVPPPVSLSTNGTSTTGFFAAAGERPHNLKLGSETRGSACLSSSCISDIFAPGRCPSSGKSGCFSPLLASPASVATASLCLSPGKNERVLGKGSAAHSEKGERAHCREETHARHTLHEIPFLTPRRHQDSSCLLFIDAPSPSRVSLLQAPIGSEQSLLYPSERPSRPSTVRSLSFCECVSPLTLPPSSPSSHCHAKEKLLAQKGQVSPSGDSTGACSPASLGSASRPVSPGSASPHFPRTRFLIEKKSEERGPEKQRPSPSNSFPEHRGESKTNGFRPSGRNLCQPQNSREAEVLECGEEWRKNTCESKTRSESREYISDSLLSPQPSPLFAASGTTCAGPHDSCSVSPLLYSASISQTVKACPEAVTSAPSFLSSASTPSPTQGSRPPPFFSRASLYPQSSSRASYESAPSPLCLLRPPKGDPATPQREREEERRNLVQEPLPGMSPPSFPRIVFDHLRAARGRHAGKHGLSSVPFPESFASTVSVPSTSFAPSGSAQSSSLSASSRVSAGPPNSQRAKPDARQGQETQTLDGTSQHLPAQEGRQDSGRELDSRDSHALCPRELPSPPPLSPPNHLLSSSHSSSGAALPSSRVSLHFSSLPVPSSSLPLPSPSPSISSSSLSTHWTEEGRRLSTELSHRQVHSQSSSLSALRNSTHGSSWCFSTPPGAPSLSTTPASFPSLKVSCHLLPLSPGRTSPFNGEASDFRSSANAFVPSALHAEALKMLSASPQTGQLVTYPETFSLCSSPSLTSSLSSASSSALSAPVVAASVASPSSASGHPVPEAFRVARLAAPSSPSTQHDADYPHFPGSTGSEAKAGTEKEKVGFDARSDLSERAGAMRRAEKTKTHETQWLSETSSFSGKMLASSAQKPREEAVMRERQERIVIDRDRIEKEGRNKGDAASSLCTSIRGFDESPKVDSEESLSQAASVSSQNGYPHIHQPILPLPCVSSPSASFSSLPLSPPFVSVRHEGEADRRVQGSNKEQRSSSREGARKREIPLEGEGKHSLLSHLEHGVPPALPCAEETGERRCFSGCGGCGLCLPSSANEARETETRWLCREARMRAGKTLFGEQRERQSTREPEQERGEWREEQCRREARRERREEKNARQLRGGLEESRDGDERIGEREGETHSEQEMEDANHRDREDAEEHGRGKLLKKSGDNCERVAEETDQRSELRGWREEDERRKNTSKRRKMASDESDAAILEEKATLQNYQPLLLFLLQQAQREVILQQEKVRLQSVSDVSNHRSEDERTNRPDGWTASSLSIPFSLTFVPSSLPSSLSSLSSSLSASRGVSLPSSLTSSLLSSSLLPSSLLSSSLLPSSLLSSSLLPAVGTSPASATSFGRSEELQKHVETPWRVSHFSEIRNPSIPSAPPSSGVSHSFLTAFPSPPISSASSFSSDATPPLQAPLLFSRLTSFSSLPSSAPFLSPSASPYSAVSQKLQSPQPYSYPPASSAVHAPSLMSPHAAAPSPSLSSSFASSFSFSLASSLSSLPSSFSSPLPSPLPSLAPGLRHSAVAPFASSSSSLSSRSSPFSSLLSPDVSFQRLLESESGKFWMHAGVHVRGPRRIKEIQNLRKVELPQNTSRGSTCGLSSSRSLLASCSSTSVLSPGYSGVAQNPSYSGSSSLAVSTVSASPQGSSLPPTVCSSSLALSSSSSLSAGGSSSLLSASSSGTSSLYSHSPASSSSSAFSSSSSVCASSASPQPGASTSASSSQASSSTLSPSVSSSALPQSSRSFFLSSCAFLSPGESGLETSVDIRPFAAPTETLLHATKRKRKRENSASALRALGPRKEDAAKREKHGGAETPAETEGPSAFSPTAVSPPHRRTLTDSPAFEDYSSRPPAKVSSPVSRSCSSSSVLHSSLSPCASLGRKTKRSSGCLSSGSRLSVASGMPPVGFPPALPLFSVSSSHPSLSSSQLSDASLLSLERRLSQEREQAASHASHSAPPPSCSAQTTSLPPSFSPFSTSVFSHARSSASASASSLKILPQPQGFTASSETDASSLSLSVEPQIKSSSSHEVASLPSRSLCLSSSSVETSSSSSSLASSPVSSRTAHSSVRLHTVAQESGMSFLSGSQREWGEAVAKPNDGQAREASSLSLLGGFVEDVSTASSSRYPSSLSHSSLQKKTAVSSPPAPSSPSRTAGGRATRSVASLPSLSAVRWAAATHAVRQLPSSLSPGRRLPFPFGIANVPFATGKIKSGEEKPPRESDDGDENAGDGGQTPEGEEQDGEETTGGTEHERKRKERNPGEDKHTETCSWIRRSMRDRERKRELSKKSAEPHLEKLKKHVSGLERQTVRVDVHRDSGGARNANDERESKGRKAPETVETVRNVKTANVAEEDEGEVENLQGEKKREEGRRQRERVENAEKEPPWFEHEEKRREEVEQR